MKRFFVFALVLGMLTGCSGDASGEATNEATAKQEASVTPDLMVSMEISGMTCVQGCGNEIKEEVMKSGGVASVDFDFEMGRQPNTAKILIDSKVVTAEQLEKMILGIVDEESKEPRFSVLSVSEEPYVAPANAGGGKGGNESIAVAPIKPSSSFIELPNLLDLFSGWFIF